jgi:hypothetical protein
LFVSDAIAPRSRLSWLTIISRLGAAAFAGLALLSDGQSPRWVLLAFAGGLALLPLAWRRKAAVVPDAVFATSADYIPGGSGRGQVSGELSATATEVVWNPSAYSTRKGFLPITLSMDDCEAIGMRSGPALLDVIITIRRREGGEWQFLTHRTPGLRRAVGKLNNLVGARSV